MADELRFTGFHHLTAVSARIADNKRFYTQVLGLRLVKRSVNQDDVSAYHLFYADAVGSPGTDITFFDWAVPPERRGSHTITRTGFRVASDQTLAYWEGRLADLGVPHGEIETVDGRLQLRFEDPEGQRLALVVDGGQGPAPKPWDESPVPPEHQLRGLGPVTMTVRSLPPTDSVLRDVTNMRPVRAYEDPEGPGDQVHVYSMGPEGPHAELHVAVRPALEPARPGAGGVHHVAFRAPDDQTHRAWLDRLTEMSVPNSGWVDRFWFRSIYFREPGGVLFEIATDGPGFGVDEDMETLGEKIVLPPFLEPHRDRIVSGLKPLD
ncbi:MAG TPA: ring-cleaving dioxygenase [Trueperaceae bacterium]